MIRAQPTSLQDEHTMASRSSRLRCRGSIGSLHRNSTMMGTIRVTIRDTDSNSMVATMGTARIRTVGMTKAMRMVACRTAMDMNNITTKVTNNAIRKIMGTKIIGRLRMDEA